MAYFRKGNEFCKRCHGTYRCMLSVKRSSYIVAVIDLSKPDIYKDQDSHFLCEKMTNTRTTELTPIYTMK